MRVNSDGVVSRRMTGSILGNRVVRKEDPKFLTVGGTYVADLRRRPPRGRRVRHLRALGDGARPDHLDRHERGGGDARASSPCYTAADLGLEPAPSPFNPGVTRTLLATDVVRYVGEPLAVVADRDAPSRAKTPPSR